MSMPDEVTDAERLRLLVDNIRDYGIAMLDPDGRVVSWNVGASLVHGFARGEVLGRPFALLFPPGGEAEAARCLEAARRDGRHETEAELVCKDGRRLWADVVTTEVREGGGGSVGFTVVTRDLTERRRAEERLRQSEQTLRLLIESVRDYAIFMLDGDGVITSWNPGAENLKGYRADEAIGRHFSMFYTEADKRRRHPEEELRRARAEGSYREEGWRVRKDGTLFWAFVVITAVHDPTGRLLGFAKVTRDMTERRNAEEALRRMNESLQAQVRNQLAANREVESFSYSVSHDLRAPLRALDGFSRLVLESAGARLDDRERDYLRRIRDASQQMSQLIDAMLALSRLTRTPLAPEEVDVTAQCRAVVRSLREAEPERRVEVTVAEGLRAVADPRLLSVVWENLLRNAWKFTRRREVGHIEVGAVDHGVTRTFFVRDDGAGLDMAQAHRLFVPFQRLHRAKDFEGTGVGLATVSRIVQLHDGRIWVESEPDRGATFYLTLGEGAAP